MNRLATRITRLTAVACLLSVGAALEFASVRRSAKALVLASAMKLAILPAILLVGRTLWIRRLTWLILLFILAVPICLIFVPWQQNLPGIGRVIEFRDVSVQAGAFALEGIAFTVPAVSPAAASASAP